MKDALILIVEDDEKSRKLLTDVLSFNGFRPLACESGEEGVQLAVERQPALILMDIHLPGISGIEALRALRAHEATRPIPIVAVTASVMSNEQNEVMSAGFDAFESKPISIARLLATVRRLLGDRPLEGKG